MRDRIDEVRRDLAERIQHETATAEARVGNLQIVGVNHLVAGQNQIEVERARRAGVRARASRLLFDGAEGIEDVARGEVGLPHSDGVQEWRIVLEPGADRRGFDDWRKPEVVQDVRERISSRVDVPLPRSQVRPERDHDRTHYS